MGIPIFAILFGFIVGWFLPRLFVHDAADLRQQLKLCLSAAFLTSSFTFCVMAIFWIPATRMLLDPSADFANFGIPMILFDPKASFIGWILLMVVISPCLQVLSTAFTASMRIAVRMPFSTREPQNNLSSN